MMRINIPEPLKSGEKVSFSIKWWYNIPDHTVDRARSGYEYFPKDGNRAYVIAQFFPRMAVYNDVEGWQNHQFWGSGEFALPFGNYDVSITVPADHVLDATGELQNRDEVFSKEMLKRYKQAKKSYDKPVIIVTQEEAEAAEKGFSTDTKTWKFKATNVRDYAFASSRKFVWDMQAVKIGNKDVMAVSLYPKEGNPLWEELRDIAHGMTIVPILGSVLNEQLMAEIMQEHRIDVVLHAAAYKHLPLVECNVLSGLNNNVIGTKVLADIAREAPSPSGLGAVI